jgi:DNA-binding transcriptional ArsR family regulator
VTLYQQLQKPALVQALAHPLRFRMLSILQEREASPKELAAEFDIPLANVAYHIQVLRKLKLIKLVKKTPRRGAVEHHYRADYGAHIDNEAWSQTPDAVKKGMVGAALAEVGRDVTDAAAIGGFEHFDAHLSRSKFVLDQEAWEELGEMLQAVLERGDELQVESAKRLKASGHEGERRAGLVMMLFESMPAVPGADAAKRPAKSGRSAPAKPRGRASRVTA